MQESLDRYISARAAAELEGLRRNGGVAAADAATVNPMLDRLGEATRPPRMPDAAETAGLSQAQQYDVYGSIVAQRCNIAANDAMATQDRVVLGLRDENRTTEARGRGVYDDRIVVLWKDAQGRGHVREFNQATTEPTAQYDGHAKTAPRSPGFGNVAPRTKTEGEDVNGDRVKDLGRLGEGTTEMRATTHPRNGHPDEFALRPSQDAITAGAGRVERDSNGDGWFDARDTQGVPSAGRAAGETLFLVQGSPGDPAALRAGVNAAEVRETAVESSLRQLQQQSREQAAPVPAPAQQQEAPAMGGR